MNRQEMDDPRACPQSGHCLPPGVEAHAFVGSDARRSTRITNNIAMRQQVQRRRWRAWCPPCGRDVGVTAAGIVARHYTDATWPSLKGSLTAQESPDAHA